MPKKMWNKPTSKLKNNIFLYDLETGSKFANIAEPLEMAGIIINIETLLPVEDGTFGPVLIKPTDWSLVEDQALAVNQLTKQEIEEKGIEQKEWFHQLVDFLQKFQRTKGKWDSLISAGFNIVNYDNVIMNRLAINYGYVDKDNIPILFHPIHKIDILDLIRPWFFSNNELESYSLENVSKYLGIVNNSAHTAMGDIMTTYKIMRRFLNFHKNLAPKYLSQFKNCFGEKK